MAFPFQQDHSSIFENIKEVAKTYSNKLKVVICLDEAYNCPILVRSIIAKPKYMSQRVASTLFKDIQDIKIVFSCAGTKATRASVGSCDDNYRAIDPVATTDGAGEAIFDRFIHPQMDRHSEEASTCGGACIIL